MRYGLPPLRSTSTWRERSASTCLPWDGKRALNVPLPASRPRTTALRGEADAAPAPHLAVGDDGARGRGVEDPGARDRVVQGAQAGLDDADGRRRGSRARRAGHDRDQALPLGLRGRLLRGGRVAGADVQLALGRLQRGPRSRAAGPDGATVFWRTWWLPRIEPDADASGRRRTGRACRARGPSSPRTITLSWPTLLDALELDRQRRRGGRRRGRRGWGPAGWAWASAAASARRRLKG